MGRVGNSGKGASWRCAKWVGVEEVGFGNGFWRREWDEREMGSEGLGLEKHWVGLGGECGWRSMRKKGRGVEIEYSDSLDN